LNGKAPPLKNKTNENDRKEKLNNMGEVKIRYGNLMQADIIVSTTDHAQSRAIRAAIGGVVSHALIYTGQSSIVESITEGVREIPIAKAITEDTTLAIVLRHNGLSQGQRQEIIGAARKFLGRPYDKIGAAGSGINSTRGALISLAGCGIVGAQVCAGGIAAIRDNARPEKADEAFFCSELVARAFELAGAKLVTTTPSYANPRMIHTSKVLQYVGHLRGA
jgi:uncharacterized protein YycO